MRRISAALLLSGCLDGVPRSVGAHEDLCGDCHPDQAAELEEGALADTVSTALFQALRDEIDAQLGVAGTTLCDRCHLPLVGDDHGLSCATCHAAVGNTGPGDGLLLFDLAGPVRGPTGFTDPRSPHDVLAGGFANDSALCGTCHDVNVTAGFHETPFAHWRDAEPLRDGGSCVDCHMSPVPGVDRRGLPGDLAPIANLPGLDARPQSDHRFIGLNRDLDDAIALLGRAASLSVVREGDEFVVTVRNLGLGHALPDGASFLRELWVEARDGDGWLGERAWLSTRLTRDGVEVADPVLADAQVRGAVPVGGARVLRLRGDTPSAEVCLRFRQVRPDLLAHLGLDPELAGPVREVVCVGE